ncbi:MAG: hypothetical protein HW421_3594 [Ignavibacteria bacterium]|nr:hypothetical protein [Ignavibacteria bacterium]
MKKSFLPYLVFALLGLNSLSALDTIKLNYGSTPKIDGVITAGEWSDAAKVQITSAGNKIINIYYKHDGKNLLFAYLDNLGSAKYRFPEILLDIKNDKSKGWMNDDWWFHVSSTNCVSNGSHSNYSNCRTVQPDWEANNFNIKLPDTVEIKIPFSKVGFDTAKKTIGIAFDVTNTSNAWEFWPPNTYINSPETWAVGMLLFEPTDVNDALVIDKNTIRTYPNPISHEACIEYNLNKTAHVKIEIYNSLWEKILVKADEMQTEGHYINRFQTDNVASGIYYYLIKVNSEILTGKLIILK